MTTNNLIQAILSHSKPRKGQDRTRTPEAHREAVRRACVRSQKYSTQALGTFDGMWRL